MNSKKGNTPEFGGEPPSQSDSFQQLRHYSRQHTAMLWQQSQLGVELTGEEGRLVKAMRQHPEYFELWERLASIGDDEIERDGVNPLVHVIFHTIIENQLAEQEPAQVHKTLQSLLSRGYSRHEAIHAIASVFVEQFFPVMKEQRPFDEQVYVRKLKKLARA
jgi:hypothetical protein